MVCSFWKLKQFCNPPPSVSKFVKTPQSNGKWANMPFQNEGGCALDFFISVQYEFEA
jgi:hypothetical protein